MPMPTTVTTSIQGQPRANCFPR